MRRLIYILPLLTLLCQVVEPAGRNLGLQQPFSSLPMLLTVAFMALYIAPWNEMYSDGGDQAHLSTSTDQTDRKAKSNNGFSG